MDQTGHERIRIFKNKPFARFASKNDISDADLCKAVNNAVRGLIAADLGGGVIKQRIARRGSGKSGGFRVMIFFRIGKLAILVHGFAKNEVDNIRPDELVALKKLASEMLVYGDAELQKAVASGVLVEVMCHGEREAVS